MGWILAYDSYVPEQEKHREALTALGNGYFVTRGATTDSRAGGHHYPGCYVAGLYNRLTSQVGDRDIENEDLVNIPNWLPLTFKVEDGEWFGIDDVTIDSYHLALDTQRGLLTRSFTFKDAAGRSTRWHEERLVSMADRHQAGIRLTLEPLDWQGRITIKAGLDGSVINAGVDRYKALASRHLETLETKELDAETIFLRSRTTQSRVEVAVASRLRLYQDGELHNAERETTADADTIEQTVSLVIERGGLVIEKLIALYTSRDPAISEPGEEAEQALLRSHDFASLQTRHERRWRQIWDTCDMSFERSVTNGEQVKLRVHIFHLLQTISPNSIDYDVGVPARGWHGEAYRGHIFWDELFILPVPDAASAARSCARPSATAIRRLGEARVAAKAQGYAGAMFPWQSGSNGREETQVVHLNPKSGNWLPDTSQRQRHVNAAICYNIWRYWEATRRRRLHLLLRRRAVLLDRPVLVVDRHLQRDDRPLRDQGRHGAGRVPHRLSRHRSRGGRRHRQQRLHQCHGCLADEPGARPRRDAAEDPLHQDSSRGSRSGRASSSAGTTSAASCWCRSTTATSSASSRATRSWSRSTGTPIAPSTATFIASTASSRPRARTSTTTRCSKQADVLMLFYLFSAEELDMIFEALGYEFSPEMIKRNIDYYIQRTSHGSTLSLITHAWILARSDREHSWNLFCRALDSDIEDIQGGTTPGGHPHRRHGRHRGPGPAQLSGHRDARRHAALQPGAAGRGGRPSPFSSAIAGTGSTSARPTTH